MQSGQLAKVTNKQGQLIIANFGVSKLVTKSDDWMMSKQQPLFT